MIRKNLDVQDRDRRLVEEPIILNRYLPGNDNSPTYELVVHFYNVDTIACSQLTTSLCMNGSTVWNNKGRYVDSTILKGK